MRSTPNPPLHGISALAERAVARRLCERRSVIIGGHGVATLQPGQDPEHLCVMIDGFRRQLELLLDAGFTFTTVSEMAAHVVCSGPPPPGLAALTFDDGMENNLSVVLPLLREYRVTATVFVTTGLLGKPNPWMTPSAGARMLTAEEVGRLATAGLELGAHTVSHRDLSVSDAQECARETAASRSVLQEISGQPVNVFAYPYNRTSPTAMAAVREAGFTAAVAGPGGPWTPLAMPRAMITGVDGLPSFLAKLAGVYEPAFASRPGRSLRWISRRPRVALRSLRTPR